MPSEVRAEPDAEGHVLPALSQRGAAIRAHEQARRHIHLDAAAKHGMYCATNLREYASLKPDDPKEPRFRELVNRFRNHPGLGVWKGVDEPEWGKHAI